MSSSSAAAVSIKCVWCQQDQVDAVQQQQLQLCQSCLFAPQGARNLGPLCRLCCAQLHGSADACPGNRSSFFSSACGSCGELGGDEFCQDCIRVLCVRCGPALHDTGNPAFGGHKRIKLAQLSPEGSGAFAGKSYISAAAAAAAAAAVACCCCCCGCCLLIFSVSEALKIWHVPQCAWLHLRKRCG